MGQAQLYSRPLYGIGTVARLTGVKPDTLRVWERRYNLGASHKSDSGRRLYTQADLEHLQLVAALVASGSRIGEIAASERKTLEQLIEVRNGKIRYSTPKPRLRLVGIGERLCEWLEQHQGVLNGVDALLAPVPLDKADEALFDELGSTDMLLLECSTMGSTSFQEVERLKVLLQPESVISLASQCSENWSKELESRGVSTASFPPDPGELACLFAQAAVVKTSREGINNLGELVKPRPRLLSEKQIAAARELKGGEACKCPQHLTTLIDQLAELEAVSSQCSVESWQDAAVHSCIYAYTSQARWLTEKALDLVMQEHMETGEKQAST